MLDTCKLIVGFGSRKVYQSTCDVVELKDYLIEAHSEGLRVSTKEPNSRVVQHEHKLFHIFESNCDVIALM